MMTIINNLLSCISQLICWTQDCKLETVGAFFSTSMVPILENPVTKTCVGPQGCGKFDVKSLSTLYENIWHISNPKRGVL
jgi:hypothetical protein